MQFSNFDRFCSQNLYTMSANCFSFSGTRSPDLTGASPWTPLRDFQLSVFSYKPVSVQGILYTIISAAKSLIYCEP